MLNLPRLVIAGTHSGTGKTTLATAIMAGLSRRGYSVQPFKTGPDYIDPGYHNAATGKISRNLDCWMLGVDTVRELFIRSAANADISIIEGVMGLYDGIGSTSFSSTAHVATVLSAPVLLVLDARSMARSAAAVVLGYKQMDPGIKLCGVILNRIGSLRHYRILKEAIEDTCRVPVVGYVQRNSSIELPERHLGLLPTAEKAGLTEHITAMAAAVAEGVDLDQVAALAAEAVPCPAPAAVIFPEERIDRGIRIGLVRDESFNFYYQDGLDLLEMCGVELVECSPLGGCLPNNLHGLYLGGGFPEMFLEGLSQSGIFIHNLRSAVDSGMPLYAECGGLMYLATSITDFKGREYPMAGVISGRCRMGKKRAALGYVTATSLNDNILSARGMALRGHEFHYSTLELTLDCSPAYRLNRWGDEIAREDGIIAKNVLASYVHLHFAGCPKAAARFIDHCNQYRRNTK